MKKTALVLLLFIIIAFLTYQIPIARHSLHFLISKDLEIDTLNIPSKNKAILKYAETNGRKISPTYKTAVCTEYVIGILEHFQHLSVEQKKKIRIITDKKIDSLLLKKSPIAEGVKYALVSSGIGIPIEDPKQVKAGDFVQFWFTFKGVATGHCGIVRAVNLDKGLIALYSSSPTTDGHGKQLYIWPDHTFFVRLK